ncbi:MAG: class IV adenylate cyclase [candidate division SR1 bacterium]|nr:class IV adenylate cyclase [candidate division SR1 bacterium]
MRQVEVKAKVTDLDGLKNKLVLLGYFFSPALFQQDRLYLPNALAYPDIREGTITMRIRNTNGSYSLSLKKRGELDFDDIEREITIDDSEQAAEMLKYMGYYQVLEISKVRQKASYNGLTICLDEVDGLGSFINVRKTIDGDSVTDVQAQLEKFLLNFGVNPEDIVHERYDTMIYQLGRR